MSRESLFVQPVAPHLCTSVHWIHLPGTGVGWGKCTGPSDCQILPVGLHSQGSWCRSAVRPHHEKQAIVGDEGTGLCGLLSLALRFAIWKLDELPCFEL